MFKGILSFVLKLLVAIAPVFGGALLLSAETSYPNLAKFLGTNTDKLKDVAVAGITALDVAVLAIYEVLTHLAPRRQAKRVADVFVDSLVQQFKAEIEAQGMHLGTDVRVNVMFVRRSLFTFFMRRFVWFTNSGFDGSHRDNGLGLWVGQGLCGHAFRERKTLSVDLRTSMVSTRWWPSRDNFWMFSWQRACTSHLKAIISVPIFAEEKEGLMTHHRPVGVVNVDAVSDLGADRLLSNKMRIDNFFKESGKILALLAVY